MGLEDMSRTVRAVFDSRPEREVRALWEMCSWERCGREVSPVMLVRRLDWMERIVRFVRVDRPWNCLLVGA